MFRFISKVSAIAFSVVALSALSNSPLHAASVNCDAPGQDLQKKIDAAGVGEELLISGACNNGPYRIEKDLKLIGVPHAVLRAPGGDHQVVTTVHSSVVFNNLIVLADGNNVGFHIVEGSSTDFQNVIVEGATAVGINVSESSFAAIRNSQLRDNGIGIQLVQSSSAAIYENIIEDNMAGVVVTQLSTAEVDDNVIINNKPGAGLDVGFSYGFVNTFSNPNTIEDNGTDVVCWSRGFYHFQVPQISDSNTSSIELGCKVQGVIF